MRIVAGEFKGRRLVGPEGKAARPTSDKVREALFSILGDVEGMHVLDLFAGTGALAIEAISRGASSAVLIERDSQMISVARRNIAATCGDARAKLVRRDATRYLGGEPQPFDLIFIDPPYADAVELASKLSAALTPWLADRARIVVECDCRTPLDLAVEGTLLASERNYGDTLLRIYKAS